jgi:signal peptidase I
VDIVAENDGEIESISAPVGIKIFNFWQNFQLGGKTYTVWFPPDLGEAPPGMNPLAYRAGLERGHYFRKGDPVIKMKVNAGDHLFVDRLTYNFRKPERGEIVVFATGGVPEEHRVNPPFWNIPADQFYIKRLVGLGGETIQIGEDRHLLINGKRLDAGTPHFENIYSFPPKSRPEPSQFSGHVSQPQMPFFPDSSTIYRIPDGHVMVMGDNTMNSLDSRYWGDFPETSVIGKAFFVYWPFSDRFGWGTR